MSIQSNKKSFLIIALQYFIVFACGILIGYFVTNYMLKSSSTLNSFHKEDIKGFAGSNYESSSPSVKIDISELKASISTSNTQGVVVSEVNCNSEENIKMVFYFDENELSIYGLKPVITEKNSTIAGGRNSIQITGVGNNKFLILWKDKHLNDNKIDVQIFSDNNMVYSTSYVVH